MRPASAGRQGHPFTSADLDFLRSTAGQDAIAVAAALPLTDLLTDLTRLRRQFGSFAAAAAETALLRRRAVPKFGPAAGGWLLTEAAVQQGTPALVARHRAGRLAGIAVHDLTCSIGADLAVLAAGPDLAVGSDLDPVRVAMARFNLAATGLPARVFISDALTRSSRGLLGYADPARRDDTGRRITSAETQPSLAALDEAHRHRLPILRVPPGLDFDALGRPGEVEIVSLSGTAREAVLWPPELARVRRRATVLSADGDHDELTSDDPDDCAVTGAQRYLIDPDPAVVRAGLVRQYAARHRLAQLDRHLAYLTGPALPPRMRGFLVQDHADFTEKNVLAWLRRDGVGTLEIKQRGTSVIPDLLRQRLRPRMSGDTRSAATLIVARVGRGTQAYWCRAVAPDDPTTHPERSTPASP